MRTKEGLISRVEYRASRMGLALCFTLPRERSDDRASETTEEAKREKERCGERENEKERRSHALQTVVERTWVWVSSFLGSRVSIPTFLSFQICEENLPFPHCAVREVAYQSAAITVAVALRHTCQDPFHAADTELPSG